MTATRIDGIEYRIDGDFIDLEQDCGLGEVDRIRLHRIHLQHLARECGLFAPDRTAEQTIGVLQRRLRIIAAEIKSFADWVRSGHGEDEASFPDFLQALALERLAFALVDDLPGGERPTQGHAINLIARTNQFDCPAGQEPGASLAEACTSSQPTPPATDQGQLDLLASPPAVCGCSSAERRAS